MLRRRDGWGVDGANLLTCAPHHLAISPLGTRSGI